MKIATAAPSPDDEAANVIGSIVAAVTHRLRLPEILRSAARVRSDADAKHMLRAAAEIERLRRELAEIRAAIFPYETDSTRSITDLADFITALQDVQAAESVANAREIAAMKARAERAEADAFRWKAHHDNQVSKKRDVSEKLSIVIGDARALARECEAWEKVKDVMPDWAGSAIWDEVKAARVAVNDRNALRWAKEKSQ